VKIAPFGVEQWMNEYETRCTYNLAETWGGVRKPSYHTLTSRNAAIRTDLGAYRA